MFRGKRSSRDKGRGMLRADGGDRVHHHRQGPLPATQALPQLELSQQRVSKASGLATFEARRRYWDSQNAAGSGVAELIDLKA